MAAPLGGINSGSSSADTFICAVVEASIAASRITAVHKTAVNACTGQTRAALRDALRVLLASPVVIRWSTGSARQLNTGPRRVSVGCAALRLARDINSLACLVVDRDQAADQSERDSRRNGLLRNVCRGERSRCVRQRTDSNPVHVYRCTHLIACRFKAKPATRMQGSSVSRLCRRRVSCQLLRGSSLA